ncbi:MAG: patatin-like phospholipase family protein [Reichenbachiella sp.]
MLRSLLLFLVFFLLNSMQFIWAADDPKLGLVLSGGGAKGMAHIGVIRELESHGIYPDFVTGTSMGALVGALYSIGYTPDEMEEIIVNVKWDQLLTNNTPLSEVTIEEKPYAGRYLAELGIEEGKISLPKGLIEGQKLNELFSRKTRSVHHFEDFSEFPIPFSCVATDISTGEKVVLNKGFLPEAMRASMAIPSFFTPVEIDGRLLVDGGLVRNFPVEEVIDMGADVVIGVFVSTDLKPKEELTDMVEVLSQSAFIFSAFDTREQMKQVDFLIRPDLSSYVTQSFDKSGEIILAGEKYTKTLKDSLKRFKDQYLMGKQMNPAKKMPELTEYEITKVEVEGNERIRAEYILGKLNISNGGSLSINEIENRINLLYGTRYFSKIGYSLDYVNESVTLVLKVNEAPSSKIAMAIHYDSENKIGMNVNLTIRNFLLKNSRWLVEGDIAESPRLDASFFQYLGVKQKSALSIGSDWAHLPLPVYDSTGSQNALYTTNYFNYYGQWISSNNQHFNFGIRYTGEWSDLKPKVADQANFYLEKVTLKNHSLGVFYNLNTLDRRYFTRKGTFISAIAKYKFNIDNEAEIKSNIDPDFGNVQFHTQNFYQFNFSLKSFFQISKKLVFSLESKLIISDLKLNTFNLTDYQFIGGFNPRYIHAHRYLGANDKQYYATSFTLLGTSIQYELLKDIYVQGTFNYIDSEYPMRTLGLTYDQADFGGEERRMGFGFSAGYRSSFGPIQLATARDTNGGTWKTYLNIGFYF